MSSPIQGKYVVNWLDQGKSTFPKNDPKAVPLSLFSPTDLKVNSIFYHRNQIKGTNERHLTISDHLLHEKSNHVITNGEVFHNLSFYSISFFIKWIYVLRFKFSSNCGFRHFCCCFSFFKSNSHMFPKVAFCY